jgi:hypothetical protein
MSVSEIKVPEVNRQRHGRAEHADGITLIDREITEHQQTPHRAAFPKSEWDYAFPGALRRDPLDQEAETEHDAAGQAHDLPGMDQDPKYVGLSEKLETLHKGPRFLQGTALYKPVSFDRSFLSG